MTKTPIVLAIDDSPDVLSLLVARLSPDGIRVVTATDGLRGFELAVSLEPDLVLLDVDLPQQSGLDICRRLKGDPRTSGIPVIFLSAETRTATKVHGFDLGAVDYVTKPFDHAELRARVRTALRLKHTHEKLARKAQIDSLTGLANRAGLDERLAAEIATSGRSGRPFCLVMADLDHFKSINDEHGHPFGDLVLSRVGQVLVKTVRPVDVACRYGGEEFALVLVDTNLAGASAAAERIRYQIRELQLIAPKRQVNVTASFGIAEFVSGNDAATLLKRADDALYEAKAAGRDCIRLAPATPLVKLRTIPPPISKAS